MTKLKKVMVVLAIIFISSNVFAEEKTGFMSNLKQLKEISDVMDIISEDFVGDKELDKTILMQGALKGMIEALEDPHSNYFSKEGMKDLEEKISGEYTGVGMIIRKNSNEPVIVELLIEGTPAFKAGIRPNDKIIKIDDESTYTMELEDASRKLKGKVNTKVKVLIYRDSEKKEKEVTLTRANIKLENVKSRMLEDKIGYIKLTQFAADVDLQVKKELEKLQKEGMKGLIFDLRNNPGGRIDQAIKIGSMFVKEDIIVSEKPKNGEEIFSKREGKYYGDFPLIILINEGSASASEIVSGAVRDYKRGILLGEKSYGKGSVQALIPLPDEDGIKLTIAKYYTPSGENINGKGIEPDIKVEEKNDFLFYDGLITNINEEEKEKNREKLLKDAVGEEEAKDLISKEDKQLKAATEEMLKLIKKRK